MIFDFYPVIEYIGVTSQYSNAVLLAIMPHVSDFAQKLELPMPTPVTAAYVSSFGCDNKRGEVGGSVTVGKCCVFSFSHGYVTGFEGPHSYFGLQNPDDIPKFYGSDRMNKDEAIRLARNAIKKLGYTLESVFAELEPKVTLPEQLGTNVIPHYRIQWLNPRGGFPSVDIEVNGNRKRIEAMDFFNRNLNRPPPKIDVQPETLRKGDVGWWTTRPLINPEYGYRLLPIVMKAVDEYGKKLDLPLPRPLTTNHVERFKCEDNGGWPHSEFELTNGYRFIYRNSMVNGFYAPDEFFASDKRKILIRDFTGKWNMTESEVVALARKTVARLGYPKGFAHTEEQPQIQKPVMVGKELIPRYKVIWMHPNPQEMTQWIEVEVDADKGTVKSLYFDDQSFWGHPPKIDIPISLKPLEK